MTQIEYRPRIKEMPEGERPRERLEFYGESALSNAELLAIALRIGSHGESAVGLGLRLLAEFSGLTGLAQASVRELCRVRGVGPAKAVQVKAALELGRRLLLSSDDSRPQITCPEDAARLFMSTMSTQQQEQMRVMLLDTKHRVLRIPTVCVGSLNTSMVRIADVFREAVKDNAFAIIVAHNHPSGDPTPSPEDVTVTSAIVHAGDLLDIKVLDHLIIGKQRHVSLKDRGLGFSRDA